MQKYENCLENPMESSANNNNYNVRKYGEKIAQMKQKHQCPTKDELFTVYLYTANSDLASAFHKACYDKQHITCHWRQFYKNLTRFIVKYNETFHRNNPEINNEVFFDTLYHGTCAQIIDNTNNHYFNQNTKHIKKIFTVFSASTSKQRALNFGNEIFEFTKVRDSLRRGILKGIKMH